MPDWFRRRVPRGATEGGTHSSKEDNQANAVPEGAFVKCDQCGAILYTKDFLRDLKVCGKCGHHHRLSADERIAWTVDEDSFTERETHLLTADPLQFPEYTEKLAKGQRQSGRSDALVVGTACIGGAACVLAVMDFGFIGGTMGSVLGEKFARAVDLAIAERLPVVLFCASGGARMQEGLFGLMQMAKTSAAIAQLGEACLPYIVILTDPTTGGALASFASLGDVIYAEPGATVAFAGPRVAQQAMTQKPPPNYQTSEFQLEHGMVDDILARKEIPQALAQTLAMLTDCAAAKNAAASRIASAARGAQ